MLSKVLGYGIVGLLATALVAGTGHILLSPEGTQTGINSLGGRGRGREPVAAFDEDCLNASNQGARGRSETAQGRGASGNGTFGAENAAGGRGQGNAAQGQAWTLIEWETLTGTVVDADDGIAVQTAEGTVIVGLGQAAYREGFSLETGNKVSITGFYEDGEFKAGTVENLSTGQTITLRDEDGRPMWAGRGQRQNQRSLDN